MILICFTEDLSKTKSLVVNVIKSKEGEREKLPASACAGELSLHCSEQRSSVEGLREDVRFDVFFCTSDDDSNRGPHTYTGQMDKLEGRRYEQECQGRSILLKGIRG